MNMNARIVVTGIYDSRTVNILKESELSSFGIDLRPTSFNFLQLDNLKNIIKENHSFIKNIGLHFSNEADFVVKSFVDEVAALEKEALNVKFYLEFSDFISAEFYDQFETPFIWHMNRDTNYKVIFEAKNLKAIVLNGDDLKELSESGQLMNFTSNFYTLLRKRSTPVEIGLSLRFDSNIPSSIMEVFDFDFVQVEVSNKVEVCYRNIDKEKIQKGIEDIRRLIPSSN